MDKLETDLAAIRKAFNHRIMYFRQLQEISDSVVAAAWEGNVDVAIQQCIQERAILDARINTNRARHRYMLHLAKRREQGQVDEDEETCILCRTDFIRGFITPWYVLVQFSKSLIMLFRSAHIFCEVNAKINDAVVAVLIVFQGCLKAWMLKREGKSCPVCR